MTVAKKLAEASWQLALFAGDSPWEMGDGEPVDLKGIAAIATSGAYALERACTLRDQAVRQAERFAAERDDALAREAAVSRELARALARIEALGG